LFYRITENNKKSQNNTKRDNKTEGNSNILWHGYSLSCIILIITTARVMDSKALLKVQMGLLHPLVDRPHL
jgi:hypothetical protein